MPDSVNPTKPKALDLEIKDAQLIFNRVWNDLLAELGEERLNFPREFFWLNGAPGAGKGTQTEYIMEYCGLTAKPIVISDLLKSEEARRRKDAGMMVGDREVTMALMRELLKPEAHTGVVIDGYPRTKVQVECLKLFYEKLVALRVKYFGTDLEVAFPKPIFHIVVLYVDEPVSVHRQLERGRKAAEANERAKAVGSDVFIEVRKTDLSADAARNRYRTFKEITYDALTSLREIFHYHFINGQETIDVVQKRIVQELKYQSSLELDQRTYDLLSPLPVASSIVVHARQQLVERLDHYSLHHRALFERVMTAVREKFMPIVLRHAISGLAYINSEDSLFEEPLSLAMFIDIFSERGYHATVDIRIEEVPERIDLTTGMIKTRRKRVYRFAIRFQGSVIRRGH